MGCYTHMMLNLRITIHLEIINSRCVPLLIKMMCNYSAPSLKRRFLLLSVGISKETANTSTAEPCFAQAAEAARFRNSRNANRSPIHPSCSTLIAWLGRAAERVILQNKQELKRF